jgi:hypothetical protein
VNPVPLNASVTYVATVVSEYGGALTGTVTFKDRSFSKTVPLTAGSAVIIETYRTPGAHHITATYSGDVNNIASSAMLIEHVKNHTLPSHTVVLSSGSPSFINQPVTFTASVTSHFGRIPNGETVTFYDGTVVIGTGITVNGIATIKISFTTPHRHRIEASYPGDDTLKPSSGTVIQVVLQYSPTALSASSRP